MILQNLSWRWIFYVNVPIGSLALVMAWRLLPRSSRSTPSASTCRPRAALARARRDRVRSVRDLEPRRHRIHLGVAADRRRRGLRAGFVWHALHTRRRPLLDLTLFREPGFAAAAAAVLLMGAALFGSLILLPLYFQIDRGHSTFATGLLLAPQGIGAALTMPISGRLTDRIGGGPVVLFGLLVMTATTIGLTMWTAQTPVAVTSATLFVRGIGLGCSMMPAMASAYSTISREAVPRATTTLNVLQRVGGSIGTALLAVVLENQIRTAIPRAAGLGGAIRPLPPARPRADRDAAGPGVREHVLVGGGADRAGDRARDPARGQGARRRYGAARRRGAAGGLMP